MKMLVLIFNFYKSSVWVIGKEGCRLVYLDGLLRQRLKFIANNREFREKLWENLIKKGYENLLESPDNYESVSIWGAGYLTKLL